MGHRFLLATFAVTVLAASGAGGTWAVATDHNPVESTDPTGDSGAAADISNVLTANTIAGVIRFEVTLANRPTLPENSDVIAVVIDSDRNGTVDYEIHSVGLLGLELVRMGASGPEPVTASLLTKIWSSGKLTLQIPSADLGNTTAFVYYVGTGVLSGSSATLEDFAPDGDQAFSYSLATPHIATVAPAYSPASPRAGRRFRVTRALIRFATDEESPAESLRCTARLGSKALRGTAPGACTYALPRNAKGKRLSLTITTTFRDQTATITRSLRVR